MDSTKCSCTERDHKSDLYQRRGRNGIHLINLGRKGMSGGRVNGRDGLLHAQKLDFREITERLYDAVRLLQE